MKYEHIIWDWNGTLIDDTWTFHKALCQLCQENNVKSPEYEEFRDSFFFPVYDYYLQIGFKISQQDFIKLTNRYNQVYNAISHEAELHNGVVDLLEHTLQKNKEQSILSASRQDFLNSIIEDRGLKKYFKNIVGLQTTKADSKISNGIQLVKDLDIDPKKIILIGDTDHDAEVAAETGISCILVSHGNLTRRRLEVTGYPIVDDLPSVLELISED